MYFDPGDRFSFSRYSPEQQAALRDLVAWLGRVYPLVNPLPSQSYQDIIHKAGQRHVVEHLKSILREE